MRNVAVDAVIVANNRIALIKRLNPPYQGCWALPGGFVEPGETLEQTCVREAQEETSLHVYVKDFIGVYSDPTRDPRGHTISVAYLCIHKGGTLKGADDAKEAQWFSLDNLPKLAFDHAKIIAQRP